jgi:hypothetical protein
MDIATMDLLIFSVGEKEASSDIQRHPATSSNSRRLSGCLFVLLDIHTSRSTLSSIHSHCLPVHLSCTASSPKPRVSLPRARRDEQRPSG